MTAQYHNVKCLARWKIYHLVVQVQGGGGGEGGGGGVYNGLCWLRKENCTGGGGESEAGGGNYILICLKKSILKVSTSFIYLQIN